MPRIDTVVIGGGQAGLAVSHELTARGRDHVVLERHELGARWRRETWDSLRLLTPNWMNTLPGAPALGTDPNGFTTAAGFADHLHQYARSFDAPVRRGVAVDALRRWGDRFEVATSAGTWRAGHVVVATGWCDQPAVPALARSLAVGQLVPADYRRPGEVPAGGVLVVGASATGVQLAHELRLAGRDVTLAVGSHTRVPRQYRGMDIFWWLARIGALDRTIDTMPDGVAARQEPSLQLVGRPDRCSLDLATLQAAGVHLVGRVVGAAGHVVGLDPDLARVVTDADRRAADLLARIDAHIDEHRLGAEVLGAEALPTIRPTTAPTELDLRARGIGTVIWATGHRRRYPWLQVPVLDAGGEIRQHRGLTPVPGLYVLGQRFQHRRRSNFIGGVGLDAHDVAAHITDGRLPDEVATSVRDQEPNRARL